MPVIFSKGCEYALQAMLFLAVQPPATPVLQRDIATALNIPTHFLGKILQSLSRSGLVTSYKGKTGGFLLNRSPRSISPLSVIEAIDGGIFLNDCVLGFPGCRDDSPCPVHVQWKEIKTDMMNMLEKQNLAQLSQALDNKLEMIKLINR